MRVWAWWETERGNAVAGTGREEGGGRGGMETHVCREPADSELGSELGL